MKLHYRILGGEIVENGYFDIPPILTENKGQWIEVADDGEPDYNHEMQVCERAGELGDGYYQIIYVVRDKTPIELWVHPQWAIRLRCVKDLLFNYSSFYLYFQIEGFPIEKDGNEMVIYCDLILPEHQTIFNQLVNQGMVIKEERPIL